jgi:hypothetical protein
LSNCQAFFGGLLTYLVIGGVGGDKEELVCEAMFFADVGEGLNGRVHSRICFMPSAFWRASLLPCLFLGFAF